MQPSPAFLQTYSLISLHCEQAGPLLRRDKMLEEIGEWR